MATQHVDEVLAKALSSDSAVIPRFDIKDASGNTVVANAQLVLKNSVTTAGTKINKQVLDEFLAASGTTAGSDTAYTLAQAGFVLADGALVRIKLHVASGATPTLNINSTGAKALMQSATKPLKAGIAAGTWLTFVYSSTLGFFLQQGSSGDGGTRFGNGVGQISSFELYFCAGGDPTNYQRPI